MNGHPGGRLEIVHDPTACTLLPLEDATRAADYERYLLQPYGFTRPTTPTEVVLLEALGYVLPAAIATQVWHITGGVRRRTWAHLTTQSTDEETAP